MAGMKALTAKCETCGRKVYAEETGEFIYEYFGKIFCCAKCREEFIKNHEGK